MRPTKRGSANFSNEAGVLGGTRFLKNITGLWLLEQCRVAWGDPPLAPLIEQAEACGAGGPIVDPNDAAFDHPNDMPAAITAAAGLPVTADRGASCGAFSTR